MRWRFRCDSESRHFQIHARYWIGLKQLAVGNRERARELFESCLKTGAFDYSHYGFAEAILARLKDPAWPRLPESR